MRSLYLIPLLMLTMLTPLFAQLQVSVNMSKKDYISGEGMRAVVSITNQSGRLIELGNTDQYRWINFNVSRNGKTLRAYRDLMHKSIKIKPGATVRSTFNLTPVYDVSQPANYSVSATVRSVIHQAAYTSNPAHCTVNNGLLLWKHRYRPPGNGSQIREYRLLASNSAPAHIYAQIIDPNTQRKYVTRSLGETMRIKNPIARVDMATNLHVLHQVQPTLYSHLIVSPTGKLLSQEYHKATSKVSLAANAKGIVKVTGGTHYDTEAERKKHLQVHKTSERPTSLFR